MSLIDVFSLQGGFTVSAPIVSDRANAPSQSFPIAQVMSLKNKENSQYSLLSDAVQTISLGGCAAVHALVIKATGGKVRLRITSADGSQQSIPVDPLCILLAASVPITALDVMRQPGVETVVQVFLGEKA